MYLHVLQPVLQVAETCCTKVELHCNVYFNVQCYHNLQQGGNIYNNTFTWLDDKLKENVAYSA